MHPSIYLKNVLSTDIQNWHYYNAYQLINSTAQYELIDMSHSHESCISRFLLLRGFVWVQGPLVLRCLQGLWQPRRLSTARDSIWSPVYAKGHLACFGMCLSAEFRGRECTVSKWYNHGIVSRVYPFSKQNFTTRTTNWNTVWYTIITPSLYILTLPTDDLQMAHVCLPSVSCMSASAWLNTLPLTRAWELRSGAISTDLGMRCLKCPAQATMRNILKGHLCWAVHKAGVASSLEPVLRRLLGMECGTNCMQH
jgi:hypothetical protein